jgi:L-cysteine:1D-myo-inositol 2-amino-2-deoxy-alpha-D-glucopyranoside ligase
MSKSKGNLVLVSKLRDAGTDPMAIRLALLAHPHDSEWEWQGSELDTATERLAGWRNAFARPLGPDADGLIATLRQSLRDGIDTPSALAAVDAWADASGEDPAGGQTAATAVDALLGIV